MTIHVYMCVKKYIIIYIYSMYIYLVICQVLSNGSELNSKSVATPQRHRIRTILEGSESGALL